MTKSQRFLQQNLFSGDLQFCCACRHWCTAHLQTDSMSSYHCPAAMSRWCRTGKTSVLAHKLLISPSGSIALRRSDPKTHLSTLGQGATALQRLSFTPACFCFPAWALKSALPHPCPSFIPLPTNPAPKAAEETQHRSPIVLSHRKPAGNAAGSSFWGGKRQVLSSPAEQQGTLENRLRRQLWKQQTPTSQGQQDSRTSAPELLLQQ